MVEQGETQKLFSAPQHDYTKMLLAAEPEGHKSAPSEDAASVLSGNDVRMSLFNSAAAIGSEVKPPHYMRSIMSMSTLREQQTIGIVGESGSGKSTLARALLQLLPSKGEINFNGQRIQGFSREQMQPLRRQLQIVFQDPFGSLSPRMTSGQVVTEGLLVHEPELSAKQRDQRAALAFEEVELDPAWRNRYPHEFSGGQRQRIAIARAMILKPKVIVLDEPTSALDRSVQKQIISLLRNLQADYGLSYLFISHDLAVVRAMSDHIMVMKSGKVVEQGPTESIFTEPQQDYTKLLLNAAFAD